MPPLPALLTRLAARGVNELHVEAGPTLTGTLLNAKLADELLVYLAPTILGPGRSFAQLPARAELPLPDYRFHRTQGVGRDLRLLLRRAPTSDSGVSPDP